MVKVTMELKNFESQGFEEPHCYQESIYLLLNHIPFEKDQLIKCGLWRILQAVFLLLKLLFDKRTRTLLEIPRFYLISWCGNFVETYNFRRTSGNCVSLKCPHQEIKWNYGIFCRCNYYLEGEQDLIH